MEMEAEVLNIKLTSRQNPEEIGESILAVEVKYNKSLPEAKKAAVVIRLGKKDYATVITVTQTITGSFRQNLSIRRRQRPNRTRSSSKGSRSLRARRDR